MNLIKLLRIWIDNLFHYKHQSLINQLRFLNWPLDGYLAICFDLERLWNDAVYVSSSNPSYKNTLRVSFQLLRILTIFYCGELLARQLIITLNQNKHFYELWSAWRYWKMMRVSLPLLLIKTDLFLWWLRLCARQWTIAPNQNKSPLSPR